VYVNLGRAICLTAAFGFAATQASPCRAQSAATPPARNHPEWTGVYRLARGAELAGFKPEHEDEKELDAVIYAHLQPWARLKMAQTNGVADDTGAVCQLDGIFRILIRAGGFWWLPTGNKVLLVSTAVYSAGVRSIRMNGSHPKYPPPTWLGDSVGHWEGEVLVVDTVGFNDKSWLTSSMQPHSEELHVVERYRLAAKGLMELRMTVEDRQALTSPYTYSRYYKLVEPELPETICNPEPGDQQMWTEFRQKARKSGMLPATPAAP
jgi:hypothetical protein